jgi:serine/threonine-protein kinase
VPINSHETLAAVEELVGQGRYAEAAKVAREAGLNQRAAELFERIWEFGEAAACAREAGDLPRALRNALDARNDALAIEVEQTLVAAGEPGVRTAFEVLGQRRRYARAAPLAEILGDRAQAVELYKRAGNDLEAARLLEEDGRDSEAGRLLERVVQAGDDAPSMRRAHLRLGLLLARRMQHDLAVGHLQEAARHEETRDAAQRALVVELVALGLRDGARDVLADARRRDPSLPADVDELVRSERLVIAPVTEERDLEIVAGRYRLEQLIGAGGSGRVFRARDEVSGRQVALKMLNTAFARGRKLYERFVREATVAGALRHANLVEVYDFSGDHGYTVMELMVGGSLRERLGGPMDQAAVRRMALDVLAGLEQAHQRGVIHRDVKPANIFFDARGTAKLGDFGVAHLLDLGQTQTGGLIGTLAYMSPEQITGARLSIAADLYAVGITLFEALTGRLPFLGPDFVAQHLGAPPPRASELVDELAPGWDPILERLLIKDPAARYESIDELRRAINAIDFGDDAGPRPLILPRAPARGSSGTTTRTTGSRPATAPDEPAAESPAESRYGFSSPLGRTEISVLSRALDTVLNRSVIVEQFDEGAITDEVEKRLYVLARGGGPFMQRALGFDRPAGIAVFEAPAGAPTTELYAREPLRARMAARMTKRLARALASLHESGEAHGALDANCVVIDEVGNPTVLVAGLGPPTASASALGDVQAIIGIICAAMHVPNPTGRVEELVEAVLAELSPMERNAVLAGPRPTTAEELYTFADALEVALLKARRRARVSADAD